MCGLSGDRNCCGYSSHGADNDIGLQYDSLFHLSQEKKESLDHE